MEFRHAAVSAFFRLMIGRKRAAVDVVEVLFDDDDLDGDAKDQRLRRRDRRRAAAAACGASAGARRREAAAVADAAAAQAWSKAERVASRHDPLEGI